jgi:hypothetical protein
MAGTADVQVGIAAFLASDRRNSLAARHESMDPPETSEELVLIRGFLDVCNTSVHITFVSRSPNREKILTEGLRVVHERGFAGASVRDIVEAAKVPQGSFTNHFASKEAFCLENP